MSTIVTEIFKETLLNWIIDVSVPFSVVNNSYFKRFLSLLNEDLVSQTLPYTSTTISN